jgi:hypothetical protein
MIFEALEFFGHAHAQTAALCFVLVVSRRMRRARRPRA